MCSSRSVASAGNPPTGSYVGAGVATFADPDDCARLLVVRLPFNLNTNAELPRRFERGVEGGRLQCACPLVALSM